MEKTLPENRNISVKNVDTVLLKKIKNNLRLNQIEYSMIGY